MWRWVTFLLPQQLFKGKFYYCLGLDVRNITNKSDCLLANYKWVHHKYNFDNLGQVSLFSDWAYQITWQIHKIPNTEQLNLLLCSMYLYLCAFIPARHHMWFLHHMWLSICPGTLFVCSTPIYLCFSCLSFHPSPFFCVSLHGLVWTCVYVLQALMSLFVLASKDGWVNIMYHGLDAVAVDQQVMLFV